MKALYLIGLYIFL